MKRPPFPTQDDLVRGFLDLLRSEHGTELHDESFWTFMAMQDLVEEFPDEAFAVVKELLKADDWQHLVGQIAAGPIEDLLVHHGPRMIDCIEAEACANPRLKHALGGVWKSNSSPEIWTRVEAARGDPWNN